MAIDQPGSYVLSATLRGYHVRESPFNVTAGSGFFSDHLAQPKAHAASPNRVKDPLKTSDQAVGTIAQQHARALHAIERSNELAPCRRVSAALLHVVAHASLESGGRTKRPIGRNAGETHEASSQGQAVDGD